MPERGCDLLVSFFLLSSIVATTEAAELPSIRDFVRHAEIRSVTVSPEGTYIAISQQKSEIEALTILKSSSLAHVSSVRFNDHEGFTDVMWVNEEKLLLSPTYRLSESRRAKYPTGEIAVVDADGTDLEVIFRPHYRRHILSNDIYVRRTFNGSGRVIDLVPENPELVVMESRGSTPKGIYNAALKINVQTGTITRLATSPVRNGRFVTDSNHRIGFVGGYDAERNYELHHRDPASGNFSLIDETPMKLGDRRPLLPYGSEGTYVFSESSTNATTRLVAWNPLTKFYEVLFQNKEADWEKYYTRVDRSIWSVRYFDHFPKFTYVDESSPLTKLHKAFTASFPSDNVELINQTDDETLSTIYVSGPTNPGVFYVVKTNESRVVTQLEARPSLKGVTLAEMMPFEVKARDGMAIRGYLTLPVGQQTHLPLIVLVHDGPDGVYDKWEYNPEVQLFASRGYAVLQVNYRGSGGRGLSFKNAGYGQWGLAMQDDITDVVKYTI